MSNLGSYHFPQKKRLYLAINNPDVSLLADVLGVPLGGSVVESNNNTQLLGSFIHSLIHSFAKITRNINKHFKACQKSLNKGFILCKHDYWARK